MRVLIDYRPALRARTGVGEYVHELVLALARRRAVPAVDRAGRAGSANAAAPAPLDIVLFTSSWKDRLDVPLEELADVRTVDRRIPVRVLNLAWHRLEWPPAELLAGPVDVVHSPSPLLVPARHAAQVVTVHDVDFLRHPERVTAEIRRDYPRLAAAHVNRADAILVNSAYTASQAVEYLDAPRDRIIVAYPGSPSWARPRPPAPDSVGPILFLGSLEPRKNLGVLLAAYRLLLDRWAAAPPLVLAGKVTDAAVAWLAEAHQPPLAGHVTALGYVPEAERRALYGRAAAFVLPSHDEGFGLTALEAMAVGVPVVAAARGALPEVVGDAGLLVEGDDPGRWADAIERVLRDRRLAATCAAAGLGRAARFSWEATAERVVAAYHAAVSQKAGRNAPGGTA